MTDLTAKSATGLTLANKVTIARIMGIPFFVLLVIYYLTGLREGDPNEWERHAALALFVVVAATDALDGYLARRRHEITRLGRALDPLADKALLVSSLILLTRPSLPGLDPHIPIWLTTVVLSRDAVLIAGYFLIHHFVGHVEVRPRWSGKSATVFQMLTVIWVLMQRESLFGPITWVAGVLTLVSMAQYVLDGIRQLERVARH